MNIINSGNCPRFELMNPIFISHLNTCLSAVSNLPPFSITSTFRTQGENAAAGGLSNSRHLTGEAIDLVFSWLPTFPGSPCSTLDIVNEGDHIHFENKTSFAALLDIVSNKNNWYLIGGTFAVLLILYFIFR